MLSFERLTARNEYGIAYLVNVKPDEQEVDSPYKNTLKCILDCFERLAQYEESEIARQSATSEEVQREIVRLSDVLEQTREAAKELKEQKYAVNMLPVYDQIKSLELQITALQAYQPWISVGERLPEIPEGRYGVMCNVMVDNCSSTKVMSLLYEKDTVRGKTVCRWKWYGKISPWNVTHWKPLPEPPTEEGETK